MNKDFQPVRESILDSWLQIRARPGLFASVWLIFGVILPMAISLILNLGQISNSSEEANPAFNILPLTFNLLLNGLLLLYIITILGSIIRAFRKKTHPVLMESVREGVRYLPGLALTIFFLFMKVIPSILLIVAGVVVANLESMNFLGNMIVISGIFLLFRFFLFYGLSPYVYFSLGTPPAEAVERTKAYYLQRQRTVSWLFFLCMILPFMVYIYLVPMILSKASILQIQIFFIFSNLLPFLAMIIYVNFSMNEFAE